MIKIKYTLLLLLTFLITGCSIGQKTITVERKSIFNEKTNVVNSNNIENNLYKEEREVNKDLSSLLSKKEKDFYEILKTDKYASLCNSKSKFENIKYLKNKSEVSKELEEIFYNYTYNLANSCIEQKSFLKTLSQSKYKNDAQHYEIYNKNINKESLLVKYRNKNTSINSILKDYTPKHPNFFKLIKELNNKKLSTANLYKIRLNIERLKLMKYYDTNDFIQLNVPSYNFTFYEKGENVKEFGTIVGKKEKQTPILSSKLSHFIINPTWNIPDSIAKKSIIPKALKDKNYLKKKNIIIRKNYNLDSEKINFKDVDWKKYLKDDVKYIPYKFIQMPSKTNGMGRVKFMFANDYSVYMHDTIGSWRFKINKEKIRSVSNGCVRLEHPRALMKYLTKKYTPQTYKSVRKKFFDEETDIINLSKNLPLHITYLTAYTKNGKVKFYEDIYGYDKIQKLNFNPYKL